MPATLRERFYRYAIVPNDIISDCWLWSGCRDKRGCARMAGGNKTNKLAYRISYELHKGEITPGLVICHNCNNGHLGCVNPHHLRNDTQASNIMDTTRAGKSGQQKIQVSDIPIIRSRLAAGETQQAIASDYNVQRATIGNIKTGHSFSWC